MSASSHDVPHVYIVEAQVHSAQMMTSQCCASEDRDLSLFGCHSPFESKQEP